MKPYTKFTKAVEKSAAKLKPLSDYQFNEAVRKYGVHVAKHNSKNEYVCLECGHSWKGEYKPNVECPECHAKLKTDKSRSRIWEDRCYFTVATTCNGYQVFRVFQLRTSLKMGEKSSCYCFEAFQKWFDESGKCVVRSLSRNAMCHGYCDVWVLNSELTIKRESYAHRVIYGNFVGKSRYIAKLKRNGFDGDYCNCNMYYLVKLLLSDNKYETLWKTGRRDIVQHIMDRGMVIDKYWDSLKIANRHGYAISDAGMWLDTIDMMVELGNDIRNPKLICPENLREAHDKVMAKLNKKRGKEREAARRKRAIEEAERAKVDNENYITRMEKFFGLAFDNGEIVIKPLTSVMDFLKEGEAMHHCVYTNKYYNKENTLIMRAVCDNVSIATIEFNLSNMKIMQCRGKCNSVPDKKDEIESLIVNNINQIIQIYAA